MSELKSQAGPGTALHRSFKKDFLGALLFFLVCCTCLF
jgi:hypothetical protein